MSWFIPSVVARFSISCWSVPVPTLGPDGADQTCLSMIGQTCYGKQDIVQLLSFQRIPSLLIHYPLRPYPSTLLRNMPPAWTSLGLNSREMKKARTEAGRFLGDNPPKWDDMGSDRQKARCYEFLRHLEATENSSIAEKFKQGEETLMEFLRTRTKTIRNKKSSQPKDGKSRSRILHPITVL